MNALISKNHGTTMIKSHSDESRNRFGSATPATSKRFRVNIRRTMIVKPAVSDKAGDRQMNQSQMRLTGVLLLIIAIALGVTGARFWSRPDLFHATATVKVERDKADLPELGATAAAGLDNTYFIQTEIAMIESEATLGKVIEQLDLNRSWGRRSGHDETLKTSETLERLKLRLQLQAYPGDTSINITAASDNAEESVKLANAVAQAYCEDRADRRRRLAQTALDRLTEKFTELDKKVTAAREKLAQAGQQLDPALREQAAVAGSTNAGSERLRTLRNRYSEAMLRYLAQSNQLAIFKPTDASAEEIARDLAARTEKTRAGMLAAETAAREEGHKLELVQTYQAAQQELDELNGPFTRLKKTVEELQNDLRPQEHPPARIVEPAAVPTKPATQNASQAKMFLAGGGVALALGIGLLVLGPRRRISPP